MTDVQSLWVFIWICVACFVSGFALGMCTAELRVLRRRK